MYKNLNDILYVYLETKVRKEMYCLFIMLERCIKTVKNLIHLEKGNYLIFRQI